MALIARELVPDLAQLDELTESSILRVLKGRYDRDIIYTRVQDILISINPRKPLPIYDGTSHAKYSWDRLEVKEPHVFEVAATAYRRLRETDTNQVVIVSGESGAGKTESTKHMVRHIIHMCQEGDMSLHDKIVEVNPLLESFGNAKTLMNNNSSRFAKYLEIGFTDDGNIAGATVRDYMLEKSRVVHQSPGEGTFHIFYALFAGCPRQKREDLFLNQMAGEYRMMQSDKLSLNMDESYRQMYKYNMDVLQKIHVDTNVLLAMLAGVIHITEIDFTENKQGFAEIVDAVPYAHAAILLDLDEEEFGQGLIACKKIFNGEEVVTFKSVYEARDSRDALAKVLYERIFGWLVQQINKELLHRRRGTNHVSIGILDIAGFEKLQKNSFEQLLINLVNEKLQNFMNDLIFNIEMNIYREEGIQLEGIKFENNDDTLELLEVGHKGILMTLDEVSNFKQGSDQAFVMEIKKKFAKHKRFYEPKGDLPNFSIQHFAALVTYEADGFIEKNRDRLNEELMNCMKNSKDEFIADLFMVKKGPTGTISETLHKFRKSRHGGVGGMPIPERTGERKHTRSGAELAVELGKSLKTKFGGKLKQPSVGMVSAGPRGKQPTLTSYFTQSLMQLLTRLRSADPFYVRCLKANMVQQPDTFEDVVVQDQLHYRRPTCLKANMVQQPDKFEDVIVRDQLRYNGLAEVAKIRKMGYAVRKTHVDFLKRYKWMRALRGGDDRAQISGILKSCPAKFDRAFRIGKLKVFLTDELELFLEHLLQLRETAASRTISRWVRYAIAEKRRREEEERKRREEEERQRRIEEERRNAAEERGRQEREMQEKQGALRGSIDRLKGSTLGTSQRGGGRSSAFSDTMDGPDGPRPGPSSEYGTPSSSDKSNDIQFQPSRLPRAPLPPIHIDPEKTSKKELADENPDYDQADGAASKPKKFEFWDLCQMVAREMKIVDVYERRSLKVIKVITYAIIFAMVLWCAVSQKISLMILASAQYDRTANRTESDREEDSVIAAGRHFLMTVAILIPYALIFLTSIFKWIFGNLPRPGAKTLVLCFIVETFHTLGLCTLCFLVLPELDMARGIMLMSCVAVFPALLAPVCSCKPQRHTTTKTNQPQSRTDTHKKTDRRAETKPNPELVSKPTQKQNRHTQEDRQTGGNKTKSGAGFGFRRTGAFALDILAILIMGAFIPVVLLTDPGHFLDESSVYDSTRDVVLFICSLIFISLQWWENFVDDRLCGPTKRQGPWSSFILGVKFDLQESRPVISFCMSFWKICLTSLIAWLYRSYLPINQHPEQRNIDEIGISEVLDKLGDMPLKMNAAILTLTLAGWVGNYAGSTACKLQMQVFSFSLPLMLSVPVSVVVVVLECSETFSMLSVFTDERAACFAPDSYTEDYYWLHYVYGAAVWLTLYWICRHIFFPTTERLAKIERLFMNPYYCGILFEQNFILGRKRHNRKVHKVHKDDQSTFSLSNYDSLIDENGEEKDNLDGTQQEDVNDDRYRSPNLSNIPMIYACATMWHENRQEMLQIMKSIFRMDRDQCLRKHAEVLAGKKDDDFYDFEAHIMFDDAMELNENEEFEPNQFVKLMMSIIDEAASAVYEKPMRVKSPFKVPSPYGGQLIFTMPGDNFAFVHMKDKNKIRHRKRWSQVMYMYYLLGYRIVRLCQETVSNAVTSGEINERVTWNDRHKKTVGDIGKSHIFHLFDDHVAEKASNTYLLALDGDVDFTPGAVRLLLDRMKKSEKVGAACGRIHPTGTGPVVWFQKFEYAIAHWLQKATEHVLGCVLCSPGCFSLFRGSALMDDNVMRKYTILPTEAAHHLMYDQGEDRWLCTLLLQQGYRVDYVAASDAYTFAPEGFGEFFNQRRRWMPSTVANIIDLLADYKNTVYINSNISFLYIAYQGALLVSTIVGPATVLMMIAGANLVVFKTNLINSYLIALAPAVLYFALCFIVKPKWQIFAAEILTGFYAFIMMIVFVGTAVTAAKASPLHPSVIFLAFLVLIFAGAALLHPEEWTCVIFGVLYFLLIPTGFLLLIFYSLTNLHVVSWGTREVPKKKTPEEIEAERIKAEEKKKKKERGFLSRIVPQAPLKDLKELVSNLTDIQGKKKEETDNETNRLLAKISDGIDSIKGLVDKKHGDGARRKEVRIDMDPVPDAPAPAPTPATTEPQPHGILKKTGHLPHRQSPITISDTVTNIDDSYDKRDELVNPAWAECKELGKGPIVKMKPEELKFWEGFLSKYLVPLTLSNEQKKQTQKALIELRNTVCLGMAMINLGWVAINFMFQLTSPTKIKISFSSEEDNLEENLEENMDALDDDTPADNIVSVDVLGLLFIIFFLVILLLQCVGMIIHRWGTFLHLVSVTQLHNPFKKFMNKSMEQRKDAKKATTIETKDAIKVCEKLLKEPQRDYSSSSDDGGEKDQEEAKQELYNLQKKGSRFISTSGTTLHLGTSRRLGATGTLSNSKKDVLTKSLKVLTNGLRATGSRFEHTPAMEIFQRKVQDQYLKQKDPKYSDRQLPPIKRRNRLNLGAGRSELKERPELRQRFQSERRRDLVPENDEEDVHDIIKPKGTVGRQLSKKLNVLLRTDMSNLDDPYQRGDHIQYDRRDRDRDGHRDRYDRRDGDGRDRYKRSDDNTDERHYGRYGSREPRDRRDGGRNRDSPDGGRRFGEDMEMY